MTSRILTPSVILAAVLIVPSFGSGPVNAEPPTTKVIELLHGNLVGIEGKDAHVITVELPPGQVGDRHYHPGPEIVYVLEGTGVLQPDAHKSIALSPGVVAVLDPKQVHAVTNTSPTGTLKILVVQLLDQGQPGIVWMH